MTDPDRAATARSVLQHVLQSRVRQPGSSWRLDRGFRIQTAEYEFLDLAWWYDRLDARLVEVPGLIWSDIDEKGNRLVFEVAADQLTTATEVFSELVGELGIPPNEIVVREGSPMILDVGRVTLDDISDAETLRASQRPLRGGFSYVWKDTDGSLTYCTVGFVTYYNRKPAFVTASHCSRKWGEDDNTPYYQSYESAANLVGTEAHDPNWFYCSWFEKCRMTDTNIVSGDGYEIDHGRIARPFPGTWEIDPANPYFTIVAQEFDVIVGDQIHKVGRNTGWTQGVVTATCKTHHSHTIGVQQINFRINCTDHATYARGAGDSGGPVFMRWGPSEAYLYGIHHGSVQGGDAVFNRISRVQEELGGVTYKPSTLDDTPDEPCPDPPDKNNPC